MNMIKKSNAYIIKYRVREGNNYAGGLGDREAYVDDLDDIHTYNNISWVQHIYIEYGGILSAEEIEDLKKKARKNTKQVQAQRQVVRATNRLKQAQEKLAIAQGKGRKHKNKNK